MTDYKDTLNLPKTAFPMKASLARREPETLKYWEEIQLYKKIRSLHGDNAQRFILHDGPPYANGEIHLGTTMNKVLKDVIIKSKSFSGYDAPYIPGWDCHGLPIELVVEKKVGKPGHKISLTDFRQACRHFAASQVDLQKADFQRLGVCADWDNAYLTMDASYEADGVRALARILANGHLVRGEKPVHWCTDCGSALAEAEVEYRDKRSSAIDVIFYAQDPAAFLRVFQVKADASVVIVPIWTTTPWTLPANQAVCLSPTLDYALLECQLHGQTVNLLVAEDLIDDVMMRYQSEDYQVLGTVKGEALVGMQLEHPFLDRVVPIILGDHVTTEQGTGCVHTAPAHGQEDYVAGQRYGLPIDNPVDSRSCFMDSMPIVGGMHVFKANPVVIDTLGKSGHLLFSADMQHSYPHCWRHKTPLIFRATSQWFISMDQAGLRDKALAAVESVKWIPAWGHARIAKMIEDRPDWCISRQRTWGIPIAFFVHRATGELHPNMVSLMEEIAQKIEVGGIDAWHDLDPKTLLGNEADTYDKVTDILDVWFESGISHLCVLEKRPTLHVPADLYFEGSDQHRGWFQSALLTSIAIRGEAPYLQVLTHGYVVDGKGYKMSKSIGNTIAPKEVIRESGADILRLWAAACDHTGEVSFSREILARISDAYRRIRNTARFLLSNLDDFDPKTDQVSVDQLVQLDAWAIQFTRDLQEKIVDAYARFHFQSVYQMLHNFCSLEMGSFYLDIIKDRLYTTRADGLPRRSAQTAIYHILEAMVRWLAPVLSYTAEEIWQHMQGERNESVFLNTWHVAFPSVSSDQTYWHWLMQVRDEVNRALEAHRAKGEIGSALDAHVVLYGDETVYTQLTRIEDELRFVLITSDAKVLHASDRDPTALATELPGLSIRILTSDNPKCARCWQRRHDVGCDQAHPELCQRCVDNVAGEGERRQYA